ncbi:type II secretion system F family protein [Rhodopila globiformis]|uniref:Type II secretion system protein GspF domain-containing protein n=1 Tax=Rhodopila globiformis TaxID=1071 RepID=A0A2S6MW30_RHOGL|nr:type II secretion system F family protein [Rhodopila globiformis]PPQ26562.1 hypothetical protein CCS01_29860 [Rhodopila globiformis]
MTRQQAVLFWGLLAVAMLLAAAAVAVLAREASLQTLRVRVRSVTGPRADGEAVADGWRPRKAVSLVTGIGEWLRQSAWLYSARDIDVLENVIAASGLNVRRALPAVLGGKLLFLVAILAAVIGLGIARQVTVTAWMSLLAMALPAGVVLPETALRLVQRAHMKAVERGIPDILDMLVACTEAGLGLESALEQAAAEIRATNPAMAVTMANFLDELKILPDRREAFTNLGKRSGVEGLRRMGTMLLQTLQLGTPLGHSLRAMAAELRRERMLRLEEKAVKLPTLLVFPLIFCILPVLLITLVGPSFLTLMDLMKSIHL